MLAPAPILPAQQDFSFQRGSAGTYALVAAQLKNPDGSLVDLTGATVEIQTSINGLVLTSVGGALSVDVPTATFFWYPTVEQTDMLPLGRVTKYEVWITFPDGSRGPYLDGFLIGALPSKPPTVGSQVTATIVLQGPQGPRGADGNTGGVTFTADVRLSGEQALMLVSSTRVRPVDTQSMYVYAGIGQSAAMAGGFVTAKTEGEMATNYWVWAPWLPVFVGAGGALTQTPPETGYSQIIGYAVDAVTIQLRPEPIIRIV